MPLLLIVYTSKCDKYSHSLPHKDNSRCDGFLLGPILSAVFDECSVLRVVGPHASVCYCLYMVREILRFFSIVECISQSTFSLGQQLSNSSHDLISGPAETIAEPRTNYTPNTEAKIIIHVPARGDIVIRRVCLLVVWFVLSFLCS